MNTEITERLRQMTAAQSNTEAESALRKLAVCRDGFSYEAAQAILDLKDNLPKLDTLLAVLQTWQFVKKHDVAGHARYTIDSEIIAAVGEDESAYFAHFDYYYTLAKQHHEQRDQPDLGPESANLDIAFERELTYYDAENAYWLARAYSHFLAVQGHHEQRIEWFRRVATKTKIIQSDTCVFGRWSVWAMYIWITQRGIVERICGRR
jgi:hypothetical protein